LVLNAACNRYVKSLSSFLLVVGNLVQELRPWRRLNNNCDGAFLKELRDLRKANSFFWGLAAQSLRTYLVKKAKRIWKTGEFRASTAAGV
jgi:hypothetical protein